MTRILKSIAFLSLLILSINSYGGGILGDAIETLCGKCGLGESLDNANREVKKAIPFYGDLEEGATNLVNETKVETLGPVLAKLIQASRNDARVAGVKPIPASVRNQLSGFFSETLLDKVRYRVGVGHELSVQNSSIKYGDAVGVALIDTIIFKHSSDAKNNAYLWAHELAHIRQYEAWGLNDFAKRYVRNYKSVELSADDVAFQWSVWAKNPQKGNMEYGWDRGGGDIHHFELPSDDPSMCLAACNENVRCRAWTYTRPGIQSKGAHCWLKGSIPDLRACDYCVSGKRVSQRNIVEINYDRGGGDYRHFRTNSSDYNVCLTTCQNEDRCVAWTYDKRNTNCWLKSRVPKKRKSDCCVSGVK